MQIISVKINHYKRIDIDVQITISKKMKYYRGIGKTIVYETESRVYIADCLVSKGSAVKHISDLFTPMVGIRVSLKKALAEYSFDKTARRAIWSEINKLEEEESLKTLS